MKRTRDPHPRTPVGRAVRAQDRAVKSGDPGKYRRANTSIEAAVNRHNSYVKLKTPRKKG